MKRRIASAATAGLALMALTGCFKADMDLRIDADNTVDGTMIIAFDKAFADDADEMGADGFDLDTDTLTAQGGQVTVEEYTEGDMVGEKVTFIDVPMEAFASEMNEDGTGDDFELRRDGDTFVFKASFDAGGGTGDVPGLGEEDLDASGLGDDTTKSDEPNENDSSAPEEEEASPGQITTTDEFDDMADQFGDMAEFLMKDAEIRFAFTFPGEILETNGKVDGTTVTWAPQFGEVTEMFATASAVPGGGDTSETPVGGGKATSAAKNDEESALTSWLVYGVGGLLGVLVLGGVVWLLFLRNTDGDDLDGNVDDDVTAEEETGSRSGAGPVPERVEPPVGAGAGALLGPVTPTQQPSLEERFASPTEPFDPAQHVPVPPAQPEPTPTAEPVQQQAAPVEAPAPNPAQQIQPGWYPTADGSAYRWHDGTTWTDHLQPRTPQ